ncbi:IPT/TIG domain-containing protein [Streptomyces sp. NPDC047108]|uniref:IPT/TIG domain-containing protein n=1 Tax=Streptomyces sp. NPDC047108 TaxID=3155025 RepID=UPI0033D54D04
MQNQLIPLPPIPGIPVLGPTLITVVPPVGNAGDVVVLVGLNLNNPTSVTFGGVASPTVIPLIPGVVLLATVPPGSGTVSVQVNTPTGTSNSVPFSYLVVPPLPPVPAAILPISGPAAGGTPFTIVGANLTSATVTIGGNAATGVVVNPSGTVLTGVTPAGTAGLQAVVVTGPGGSAPVASGYTYV